MKDGYSYQRTDWDVEVIEVEGSVEESEISSLSLLLLMSQVIAEEEDEEVVVEEEEEEEEVVEEAAAEEDGFDRSS